MGRAWGHCYEEALRDQEEDVVILVETIGDRGGRYMGNWSSYLSLFWVSVEYTNVLQESRDYFYEVQSF